MSAAEKFTFQTRPTPAQNAAMVRANRARYARQYRDNQDAAIAEMHAARLRYEMDRSAAQPEPCQFCAVPTPGEDGEPQVMAWVGSTPVLIIVALACVAWVIYYWGTP